MPPLLCPSPVLLDQSFPRDVDELRRVADCYGTLQGVIESGGGELVITEGLRVLAEEFDWTPPRDYRLLQDIHMLVTQWILYDHQWIVLIDVSAIGQCMPHPLPRGLPAAAGLTALWAEEVGRLLVMHCNHRNGKRYFIGVACDRAFAGEARGEYAPPISEDCFPLVGPADLESQLDDAYVWCCPEGIHDQSVSFSDAYRNVHLLGAMSIDEPPGGSHYKITFRQGHRPWPLDSNLDPIPDRYIRELVSITGFPFNVIKTALITGAMPLRHRRI